MEIPGCIPHRARWSKHSWVYHCCMTFDPHALKLYVDGSCLKNPGGASGFAVWVEYPAVWNRPDEALEGIGFHESTNQRMELRACIWAHRWVREHLPGTGVSRVQIVTDSKYVNDYWRMAEYWRSQGWRNSSNRPIKNDDLWKELLSIRGKLRVRTDIEWTLGKKAPILRSVDKSAKSAAKQPTETDRGYRPGKIGRTKNQVFGAAALFPATGQQATVRIYHTALAGRSENEIKFQLFSDSRGDFFDKFVAYTQPEIGASLHRQHAYVVQFNNDPKYPIITAILEERD